MKAIEYMALECLRRLCPHACKYSDGSDVPVEKSTTQQAYIEGFNRAKEMTSGMLVTLNVPKAESLAVLIKAMATVQVDPKTGKRISDD